MAQAPKLTPGQWEEVRDAWEQDPRDGYTWLVNEQALPVSAPAVRKAALKQGWEKRKTPSQKPSGVEFVKAPGAKPKAKRGTGPKLVSETIETMGETISETMAGGSKSKEKASAGGGCGEFDREVERAGNGSITPESDTNARARERETISETMDWDESLEESEEETSEYITETRRTRARTKIGTAPEFDPIMGELLAYDQSGLDDLFEPDIDTPGLYRHQYARIAYKFLLLGATVEALADLLGVNKDTIYQWAKKHPNFNTAMRGGRDFADANVASRLYARAMGYSHAEEVIKVVDNKIVRVNTVKHYAPDPGAAIFWLKNRQPELWKEKVEIVEKPSIALVDKDAMAAIYRDALDHAATVQARMSGRAERLGLAMDTELDDD